MAARAAVNTPLAALVTRWREEAALLDVHGAAAQATVKRRDADEVEAAFRDWWEAVLTIKQAAAERGVSYDVLWRRVHQGDIPNVGEPQAPRVRRSDLYSHQEPVTQGGPDLVGKMYGRPSRMA